MPGLSDALGEVLGAVMLHHGLELPSVIPFDPGYLPPVHLIAGESFHDPQDGLRIAFRIEDYSVDLFEYHGADEDPDYDSLVLERYVRIMNMSPLPYGWCTSDKLFLADVLKRDFAFRHAVDKLRSEAMKKGMDFEYWDGKTVRKYINGKESTTDPMSGYIDPDENVHDSYEAYCHSPDLDPYTIMLKLWSGSRTPQNESERRLLAELEEIRRQGGIPDFTENIF